MSSTETLTSPLFVGGKRYLISFVDVCSFIQPLTVNSPDSWLIVSVSGHTATPAANADYLWINGWVHLSQFVNSAFFFITHRIIIMNTRTYSRSTCTQQLRRTISVITALSQRGSD